MSNGGGEMKKKKNEMAVLPNPDNWTIKFDEFI